MSEVDFGWDIDASFDPEKFNVGEPFVYNGNKVVLERRMTLEGDKQGDEFFIPVVNETDLKRNFSDAAEVLLRRDESEIWMRHCPSEPVKKYLRDFLDNGQILPTTEDEIAAPYGYHAAASIFVGGDRRIDKIEQAKIQGWIGGGDERVGYLGIDVEHAFGHGWGDYLNTMEKVDNPEDVRLILIKIDIDSLRKKRNIFIDPESLTHSYLDEFGRVYVTHKGFPLSAIKEVFVFKQTGRV